MPIALLTDFGTSDYYVGAVKGVILSINPDAVIVDITHELEPQNITSAAFVLRACYEDFPEDTVFLCVVDPGVGSERREIIVRSERHLFVGPDNGLFSFILNEKVAVHGIENQEYFRDSVSDTFHGRDIFAPVAAYLSKGVGPAEFGPRINDPVLVSFPSPKTNNDNTITAEIIHIDRFGNLITNVARSDLPKNFYIDIGFERIAKHFRFFAESETGELFSLVGSAGFLEIVVNQGSAQKLLNAKTGQTLRLTREN